jgi:vacuolar protein sorting-associated protein VTA1
MIALNVECHVVAPEESQKQKCRLRGKNARAVLIIQDCRFFRKRSPNAFTRSHNSEVNSRKALMENKLNLPAPLKPFLRFFAQAQSLDASNPAVAYFCRLFAVERILSSGVKDKEAKHFIGNMVSRLESDASKLGSSTTAEEGQPLCEQLALSIFNHADEVDRSQQSDKSNALAFYASSVIFEICQYFGPLSPDLSEKCKYAQFKCAEISKAIREGRLPSVAAPVSSPVLQAPKAETATVTAPGFYFGFAFYFRHGCE